MTRVYNLGKDKKPESVQVMDAVRREMRMHDSNYIYVFADGRIFFTDKKLKEHDMFTKRLTYNVYGYAAYALDKNRLRKNKTLVIDKQ